MESEYVRNDEVYNKLSASDKSELNNERSVFEKKIKMEEDATFKASDGYLESQSKFVVSVLKKLNILDESIALSSLNSEENEKRLKQND